MAIDPATRLHLVDVPEPDMDEPSGDWERLHAALAAQWGIKVAPPDLPLLARLQPALIRGNYRVTAAVHTPLSGAPRILDLWPGWHEGPLLGLAIDLGSTTVAAHLCRLGDGAVLASGGVMNPQIRFGEDLMSRVSYAMMNEKAAPPP